MEFKAALVCFYLINKCLPYKKGLYNYLYRPFIFLSIYSTDVHYIELSTFFAAQKSCKNAITRTLYFKDMY